MDDLLGVLLNFMQNNVTDALHSKVLKEYKQYKVEEQGGNLYLSIALGFVYHDSEPECQAMANTITNLKITDIEGEDISIFVTMYCAGMTFLKNASRIEGPGGVTYYRYLCSDSVNLLLDKLHSTSTKDFNEFFNMFKVGLELDNSGIEKGALALGKPRPILEGDDISQRLENHFQLAPRKFIILSGNQEWSGVGMPGTLGFQAFKKICWNCRKEGHLAGECMQPRNEATIAHNCLTFQQTRSGRGRGRGQGDGQGRGGGHGPGKPTGKWHPLTAEEHNKRLIDGKPYHYNPEAEKGCGHWYEVKAPPKKTPEMTHPPPGANIAQQGMHGMPLTPSPHTSFTLDGISELTLETAANLSSDSNSSVAQASLDAARTAARKQALL